MNIKEYGGKKEFFKHDKCTGEWDRYRNEDLG